MKNALTLSVFLIILCQCSMSSKKDVTIDKSGIRKAFSNNQKNIRGCYSSELKKNPSIKPQGKVVVDFVVDAAGKAKEIKVDPTKSSLNNESLNTCLTQSMQIWSFPKPEGPGEVNVVYPLMFTAHPPKKMQNKLDKFETLRNK